jgi:hypothetical protein
MARSRSNAVEQLARVYDPDFAAEFLWKVPLVAGNDKLCM